MAFAKLSGSLLARKEARAALTLADLVSVPATAPVPGELPPVAETAPTPAQPIAAASAPQPAAAKPMPPSPSDEEAGRLLALHLKALNLTAFLDEYAMLARQCAEQGLDHSHYLLRLAELELIEREKRIIQRRVKAAQFPAVKGLDNFDFAAVPSLSRELVMELAKGDYVAHRENVIIVGNSGIGKTHLALGLGLEACRQGSSVAFVSAGALVHQLMEGGSEQRLARLQRRLTRCKLLIIDELGYVPLPPHGAELMFEIVSQRYERGSTIVTSNLPLDEWVGVFGTARLASAVIERLSHHSHVLELQGESYRRRQNRGQPPRTHGNGAGRGTPAAEDFAC